MRFTSLDLWLLLMTFFWGSNFTVVKAALREMPGPAFNGLRMVLASVVFLGLISGRDGLARSVRAIPRRGYQVAPVTVKDIHDVFELRLMLEPVAARMAAGTVGAQRLRALDEVVRSSYEPGDPGSTSRFLEASKAFQVAIARATGNSRLADTIERLLDNMTRLLHLGLGLRDRSQELSRAHRSLVKALARGDGEAAERICREQIEMARSMVLSAILASGSVMNLALQAEESK